MGSSLLFLCAAMTHSKELHYEKRKEDEEMKNFKKVIAFLMVAAMTLGMGLTAFASETTGSAVTPSTEECITFAPIEPAEAGSTVTIKLMPTKKMTFSTATLVVQLNPDVVDVSAASVKSVNSNYGKCWKLDGCTGNYKTSSPEHGENVYIGAVATTDVDSSTAEANDVVLELNVKLKTNAAVGDTIATAKFKGGVKSMVVTGTDPATGDYTYGDDVMTYPSDIVVKVTEKAQESSSDDTTKPSDDTTKPSDDINKPGDQTTTAAGGQTTTAAAGGQNTTTAAGGQNNAPALPKAADIKNTTNALEALLSMVENGKYNDVLSVAKAIDNASNFTSKDNYNNFKSKLDAYEKVLANPNATQAEKDAAYNALIETMQENLLSNSGKNNLIKNVQDKLNALNGVPATTKTGKGGKTGDTAPVAALIVVAIAAFGTAVVVYRKKVNA